MAPEEIDALATRFRNWVAVEFDTSPLYQALGPVVAGDVDILGLIARRRPGQQPTNLFFASLHFLVLSEPDSPLAAFFASVVGDAARPADEAGPVVLAFCHDHRSELEALLSGRLVQTNVVKRAAALRFALSIIAEQVDRAYLVEVGASSGVHLLADRYGYRVAGRSAGDAGSPVQIEVDWRGTSDALGDLDRQPVLAGRLGVDLNPVDVASPVERLWLRALVWPENLHEAQLLAHRCHRGRRCRPAGAPRR